jgi:hypothetical protein
MNLRVTQAQRLLDELMAATRTGTARWSATHDPTCLRLDNPGGTVLLDGPADAGAAGSYLLRLHDQTGEEVLRYDGHVPGIAGTRSLRHRAALRDLYEAASDQVHETQGALDDFLQELRRNTGDGEDQQDPPTP